MSLVTQRLSKFRGLVHHPLLGKLASRLTKPEHLECLQFIIDRGEMDNLDFEYDVNRMFLDRPHKPKHWTEMSELLMASNTGVKEE